MDLYAIGDLTDDLLTGAANAIDPSFGAGVDVIDAFMSSGSSSDDSSGGDSSGDDSGSGPEPGTLDVVTTAVPDSGSVPGGAMKVQGGGSNAVTPGTTPTPSAPSIPLGSYALAAVVIGGVAFVVYRMFRKPKRANPSRRRRRRGRR